MLIVTYKGFYVNICLQGFCFGPDNLWHCGSHTGMSASNAPCKFISSALELALYFAVKYYYDFFKWFTLLLVDMLTEMQGLCIIN